MGDNREKRICVIDGCERYRQGRGLCGKHYTWLLRRRTWVRPLTPLSKFFSKVVVQDDGCWAWHGPVDKLDYGYFGQIGGGRAYKWAYVTLVGPVPEGLVLDHLCQNTNCVRPAHLEPVTQRVNVLRAANSVGAKNAAKTHCKRGHPLEGGNLMLVPYKERMLRNCRTCSRATKQRYKDKKRGL